MLFNSVAFAIFLPIVFVAFWICPQRYRWAVLLAASYYFYMSWNVKYVVLIFLTTLISYITALLISKTNNKGKQKLYLTIALSVSLGILFIFKYFNFFSDIVFSVLRFFSFEGEMVVLDVLLPVGISFYTFQTLSYVIDVYRGTVEAESHFGKYATFVSFFPQLVAGPIERTGNLMHQIKKDFSFEYDQASYGLKLMAWGFFKKMVVADTMAFWVDIVYGCVYNYVGFPFLLSTLLFGIQIYCDFSGYSDIAIGTAKLFNIDLMRNFHSPYFAASIKEFWSRWHISLSTWFRDYVYIPLGGNRCGKWRRAWNLLVTFLISGLWHGAAWNYVIWGLIHGVGQVAEGVLTKHSRLPGVKENSRSLLVWLRVAVVFGFAMFAWIFFRIPDMEAAKFFFLHILDGAGHPLLYMQRGIAHMGVMRDELVNWGIMLVILFAFDYLNLKADVIQQISSRKGIVRWSIYIGFSLLFLFLLPTSAGGEFIYFQF